MSAVAASQPYSKARFDRLVLEIESAILSGDRAEQSRIVRRSADLLVKRWSCLPLSDKPAFDILLHNLAGEIDAEARRAFAIRLADLRRGPPRTSERLARDPDGAVAAPLLERGRSLQVAQLCEVALTCSDAHREAIARRRPIGPELTDALLARGGPDVAATLAENSEASISRTGFSILLRHASASERLALRLLAHADLSEADHAVLARLALSRAETALAAEFPGDGGTIRNLLKRAQAAPDACEAGRADRFKASVAFIASSYPNAPPRPEQIGRWLALNRIEDALAALAHRACLPIERVVAAYDAGSGTALATILRGAEWSWPILKLLLEMRHFGESRPEIVNESYAVMRDLSPLCARRLVRLGAARSRIGAFGNSGDLAWPELRSGLEAALSA